MEDLQYINDKSLARYLLPLLDDKADGYLIDDLEDPIYARICDAAINLLAEWDERALGFEVADLNIYSDEEIEEARRFIESLGE